MRSIRPVTVAAIAALLLARVAVLEAAEASRDRRTPAARATQSEVAPPPASGPGPTVTWIEALRPRLVAVGATDADMQALSDHVTHYQAQIKTPLGRAIEGLRRATSAQASDAEAKLALRKFDIELAKLAEKQQALEKDLTQKLGLADKPKLHGMLLLMGVLERGMVCSAMTFN